MEWNVEAPTCSAFDFWGRGGFEACNRQHVMSFHGQLHITRYLGSAMFVVMVCHGPSHARCYVIIVQ